MIRLDSWMHTLPIRLTGMVGVFLVIGVIVLVTLLLNALTAPKK